MSEPASSRAISPLVRRHETWGWTLVALFATLGLGLETLHAVKSSLYLEAPIRRELWRLAHAHGALVGIVNLLLAGSFARRQWRAERGELASRLLRAASLLLPGGFFLGGLAPLEADPGYGVWLAAVGGMLFIGVAVLAAIESARAENA